MDISYSSSVGAEQICLWKVQLDTEACRTALQLEALDVSDLIPGVYEGGLKLWEGSIDLVVELASSFHIAHSAPGSEAVGAVPDRNGQSTDNPARAQCAADNNDKVNTTPAPRSSLRGRRVLELGCGHGLPGIVALLGGAHVTFHVRALLPARTPNVLHIGSSSVGRRHCSASAERLRDLPQRTDNRALISFVALHVSGPSTYA